MATQGGYGADLGGGESELDGAGGDPLPVPLEEQEWVILPFTDPRSGESYDIIEGRMIVSLTNTPHQPLKDENYFDVEHPLNDPQYQTVTHPMLSNPAVAAFVAAEHLTVFAQWPEIAVLGVLLPPETTELDATVRWPVQYSSVVLAADPDEYSSAPTAGPWDPPNDHEFYNAQWYLYDRQYWNNDYEHPIFNTYKHINVHQAWREGYIGNSSSVVALIDNGTEWGIPDLDANSTPKGCNTGICPEATRFNWRSQEGGGETWTWVKNLNVQTARAIFHGTATASIMAARGRNDYEPYSPQNGNEIVGVGPEVRFFPVAALYKASASNPDGGYDQAALINALYAVGAVKGIYKPNGVFTPGVYAPYYNIEVVAYEASKKQWNTAEYTLIAELQRYMLFVCAAGNSGNAVQNEFPGRLSGMFGMTGVMSVAAHDNSGKRAVFGSKSSCFASNTTIVAPGKDTAYLDIPGTNSSGYSLGAFPDMGVYVFMDFSGTSAALAHVAGVAALINCTYSTIKPAAVKSRISQFGYQDLSNTPGDPGNFSALRRLNAYAAITQ